MTRPLSQPGRLTAAVFVLLMAATVAAFFAAQRLKHEPPLLRQKGGDRAFSPNGDGIKDSARIKFQLPEQDEVTVAILDEDGGRVARVVRNEPLPGGEVHTLRWDGRTSGGRIAAEGTYRVRVGLRTAGRTAMLARQIELDLEPPAVAIEPVRGPSRGPLVIDGQLRRTAAARVVSTGRKPGFSVWRTDGPRSRLVIDDLPLTGERRGRWDGRIDGRPAPPGTYLISGEARDPAGNVGTAPVELPPPHSGPAPGGVGVTVRPLAVTPPARPVHAGARTRVAVEAGGRRYNWSLRRVGGGRVGRGRSAASRLRIRIPRAPAGAYTLRVEVAGHEARTVIPVRGRRARRILVVLPQFTWQGRNDVDDNGDGLPDSLERDRSAGITRPFAEGRLPAGFRRHVAPLLAFLDENRLRYDLTTDVTLARSRVAPFQEHEGVVLAGDSRWFQESLGMQLKAFVERGGRVLSLGLDSLRRTVKISGGRLRDPSPRLTRDALGARIGRLTRTPIELLVQVDESGLFRGTAGSLGTFPSWEPTLDVEENRIRAVAGEVGGEPAFIAYRLGRGLVIRPGVRGWALALDDDVGPAAETMRRIWTLLA